jgi:hypothetical protein
MENLPRMRKIGASPIVFDARNGLLWHKPWNMLLKIVFLIVAVAAF